MEDMEAACRRVTKWSEINDMEVGISKCGILEFSPEEYGDRSQLKDKLLTIKIKDNMTLNSATNMYPLWNPTNISD